MTDSNSPAWQRLSNSALLRFLLLLACGWGVVKLIDYFQAVLTMFVAFGLSFEVPIVVIVLARMNLVTIQKLKDFRSYFIVLAFIIAAIVTPPDVVSQLALAIPMVLLYELGIWAAQLFIKHTRAPEDAGAEAS